MRSPLLLALAMLFIGVAANAAGYPLCGLYAGIYDANGNEGPGGSDHTRCDVFVSAPYTDIEMWIWWLPDPVKGLAAVEFKIVYPTSTYVIQGAVTSNPLNQVELGSLPTGISATVGSQCQTSWYYSHHQTLTLKKISGSGVVAIVADPGLSTPPYAILVASCEPGFPAYETTMTHGLYINGICIDATQDKTWGAIKSLYQ